ncbi:MAG: hypothetical protein MJZ35_08070 [Bacteroidaceae bacterium]|nr:hypothetical protein [Bacteroidaceae bacterium]
MKKFLLFLLVVAACYFGVKSWMGYSSESEESDDDLENYEDSIAMALDSNDFVKAYRYANHFSEYSEEAKTVVKKEAQYVLENQGESGLVRIAMIVDEHDASWVYPDLLNMAISMGNESLSCKISKLCDDVNSQTMGYAVMADMETLVTDFLQKNNSLIDNPNVIIYLKEKGTFETIGKAIREKKTAEEKKKQNEEIEKLIKSIDESQSYVVQTFRPGKTRIDTHGYDGRDAKAYQNAVVRYNGQCRELLSKAIEYKDLKTAKLSISKCKKNFYYSFYNTPGGHSCDYTLECSYDASDIDEMKSILANAINEGAFK